METSKRKTHAGAESNMEESGITSKQALIYAAIVLACFGAVYPRMIHPMLKMALGFGAAPQTPKQPDYPPQQMNRGKPMPGMRPPPPGARGETHAPDTTSKGMGVGIMGMILPIYAVGIVIYLLYTASKVYGGGEDKKKKKKRGDGSEEVYTMITERLAGLDLERILSGEDVKGAEEINQLAEHLRRKNAGEERPQNWMDNLEPVEEIVRATKAATDSARAKSASSKEKSQNKKSSKHKKERDVPVNKEDDTDVLLRKCENQEYMTPEEMRRLQTRLLEVEGRMNKLMSAIKTVGTKTTDMADKILAEENTDNSDSDESHDGECDVHNQNQLTSQKPVSDDQPHLSNDEDDYSDHHSEGDVSELEDVDREEVDEIYAELESSEDEMIGAPDDSEMGGVRRRNVHAFPEVGEDSDD